MSLFFRVSGIVAILLVFLGVGFVAGEHVEATKIPTGITMIHPGGVGEPLPPGSSIDPR